MKTIRNHRIRMQIPLLSMYFPMRAAGFEKIEECVRLSDQKRRQEREAAKKPALNLIHA